MRHHAGFTGPALDCQLLTLAEFYGMYLLNWSEELWPRDPAGQAALPAAEDDHDVTDDWNLHRRWHEHVHRRPLGRRMVQNALSA